MTATFHILTLTPTKRGRKYFTCSLPDKAYAVKLVIDSLSQGLALDVPVAIRAKDLSRHSIFGSQIIYEATQILRGHDQGVIKIAKAMDRAFQKASFRGVEVDRSLGLQGLQWRTQFYSEQVQARWEARRAKREEELAWEFAKKLLPLSLVEAMTSPRMDGVREALVGDMSLRISTIEESRQLLIKVDSNQKSSAMICLDELRDSLSFGRKRKTQITIWEIMGGILLAGQLAEEAQLAIDVAHLEQNTQKARAAARPVRL